MDWMANVIGIDVSHHQGTMNWAKAVSAGAKFAFVRAGSINATSGILYTDYKFTENASIAPTLLPTGFYWFFRSQWNAINQANYFCDLIQGKKALLPPVLDVETNDTLLSQSLFGIRIKAALDTIEARTGKIPIIYTSAGKWNPWAGKPTWASRYDLWIAHYTTRPQPYMPYSWATWRFWQWSADGNMRGPEFGGQSTSMDINYFLGDETAFRAYIGQTTPPPTLTLDQRM